MILFHRLPKVNISNGISQLAMIIMMAFFIPLILLEISVKEAIMELNLLQ